METLLYIFLALAAGLVETLLVLLAVKVIDDALERRGGK